MSNTFHSEPTEHAYPNPYYRNPYSPIAPPPPGKSYWLYILLIISLVAILGGIVASTFIIKHMLTTSPTTPTIVTTVITTKPTPVSTSITVTNAGVPIPLDATDPGSFNPFIHAFITDMQNRDYEDIDKTTQQAFGLYCDDAVFRSKCQYTWNATRAMLQNGSLQFYFPQPVQHFIGRKQCFVDGYGAATDIINVGYMETSIPKFNIARGTAQLAFVSENVGNSNAGPYRWFWWAAVLNAAC